MQVFVFHRTMSLGNWPFLALLSIISTVASASFLLDRNWVGVASMYGVIFVFPLFIGAVQSLPELIGMRVLVAVHARGIIWARLWQRGFIPWSNLARTKAGSLVEHRGADKPILLQTHKDTPAAEAFIAERIVH